MTIVIALNVIAAVCFVVVGVASWKENQANLEVNRLVNKVLDQLEAAATLLIVDDCLKKGKTFAAFDAIGMTPELIDDLTLDEARDVFTVRLADLYRVAQGKES